MSERTGWSGDHSSRRPPWSVAGARRRPRDVLPDDCVALNPNIPRSSVDGHLIVANESSGRLTVLDPVIGALVESLDGRCTVGQVAEDLAEATATDVSTAYDVVRATVVSLDADGFLTTSEVGELRARRIFAPVPEDSCLGRRMGLQRAHLMLVTRSGQPFRAGSTDATVAQALGDSVDCAPDSGPGFVETLVHRGSRGRAARTQFLFDTHGAVLHRSRDFDLSVDAFGRTVQGRLDLAGGGAWIEGASFTLNERVVLLHPALQPAALGDGFSKICQSGFEPTQSGLLRLEGSRVVVPHDRFTGRPEVDMAVAGFVAPPQQNRASLTRELLHLARHWDQTHLDQFAALAGDIPAAFVATGRLEDLIEAMHTVARGASGARL